MMDLKKIVTGTIAGCVAGAVATILTSHGLKMREENAKKPVDGPIDGEAEIVDDDDQKEV